jgi:thiol-disulfide isomerase/thioredoxin
MTSILGRAAPELGGIKGWINSVPLNMGSLRGKVVFLDFWTYSCINCVRTLPYVEELHEKYKDDGLVVIGVHTPEFPFEKDPRRVANAVEKAALRYAVALDSDNITWKLYGNHYWPRQTLVDLSGRVRFEHVGEGGYDEIESWVRVLLEEARQDRPLVPNRT